MSVRRVLPTRRGHTVIALAHAGRKYHIGFGQECDKAGVVIKPEVLEFFADARHTGTDFEAFLHDACIAMSLLVQHGCSSEMQVAAYGEHRNEGQERGAASSIMGVIARMGVEIEKG
jgi:hypothetical protein